MVTSLSSAELVSNVWWVWSASSRWWEGKSFSSLHIMQNAWKQKCGGLLTRKPWVKLWDLVLTSFQTSFWYSLKTLETLQIINLPQKENRLFKSHSLCYARKTEQPESRVSRGCQTNNCVEAVAPHKHSHHGSTNHSPIFWVPRVIDVPYLVPILILFLVKKNISSPKLFLSSANKGGCSFESTPYLYLGVTNRVCSTRVVPPKLQTSELSFQTDISRWSCSGLGEVCHMSWR